MYKYLTVLFLLLAALMAPKHSVAQYYGGQENGQKSFVVDKKIRSLNRNEYYDNIDSSQKVFVEGEGIEFRVRVSNNGNLTISNIQVADYLPKYLCLVFYPGNADNNAIFWNIAEINAGESKDYLIRAKICGLPTEIVKVKLNNQAYIKAEGISDRDYASYYVGRKTTPSTGANSLIIESIFAGLVMIGAYRGRKIARGY